MTKSEFPARWRLTTLGEIARDKPNNGIFRKNPEYLTNGSEGLPVVWVEELFRGNSIDTKNSRRVTATKAEIEKYGLKKGDVLFCRSSLKLDGIAFNNVYLGEDNAALFECHLIRISPKSEDVSSVFLNWLLRSPQVRAVAKSKSKTATMTTIDQQSLASIPIILPPLAEQRRIAEVLDQAEALRTKRRVAFAQLDTLTQSIFLDLFGDPATNPKGWTTKPLGEAMSEVYRYPTYYDITYEENGVPEIRGELLQEDGSIVTDKNRLRFISPKTSQRFPRTVLAEGDLVMSVRGTIGKIGLVPPALAGANITANLIRMAPDRSVLDPTFAWHFTQTASFKGQLANACSSTTILTIKAPDLKRLAIPLPPLDIQHDFAYRVAAVEKLKTSHRASLAELDALFASLQHRAFRGEL